MNPLGRPNNAPENPMEDLTAPYVPMNEGLGLAKTVASQKEPFNLTDENAVEKTLTPPGGTQIGWGSAEGSGMQYSSEHGRSYQGKECHGMVLRSAKTSTGNIYGKN